ncbi:MAG: hypothetical protein ACJAUW_001722, partial [Yoonia sp.]
FSFTIRKRSGWQAVLNASSVMVHAVACYFLINLNGPIGASQALAITAVYGVSMFFFVGRQFIPINLPWRELGAMPPALILLGAAALWSEQMTGVLAPLATITAGLIGFLGVLLVFGFGPARRAMRWLTRRITYR